MKEYGKELIVDLYECDVSKFNREDIKLYFKELCSLIQMKREKLVWWDDLYVLKANRETEAHLKGTSAIQFIKTSNITIHTLDILKTAYINIFSCKNFDSRVAINFTKKWFDGKVKSSTVLKRG